MKNFLLAIGIIVLSIIAYASLLALGVFGRAASTASEMADQTVFNASKHVYSYEEFIREKASYDQYDAQEKDAKKKLDDLARRDVTSGGEYDNLIMEESGARNMKRQIAAKYNAMSQTSYKKIWKGKDLPEKLGD